MAKIARHRYGHIGRIAASIALLLLMFSLGIESIAQEAKSADADWQARLRAELPLLGHRNWIVIADAAYPKQSSPGIETIYTGAGQVEVLETVLKAVSDAPHVFPVALLDKELASVPEQHALGVESYRRRLDETLKGQKVAVIVLPHEDIIDKLGDASSKFKVMLLKTDMTIPYTSVFLRLECGYWNAEKEKALRAAIANQE